MVRLYWRNLGCGNWIVLGEKLAREADHAMHACNIYPFLKNYWIFMSNNSKNNSFNFEIPEKLSGKVDF